MNASMFSCLLLITASAVLTTQSPLSSDLETRQSTSLSITVPETTPSGASDVVDHGYPGFAMSQHSFHEYAGNNSSPNTFSANLISEVASRTGSNVHIRVGGTSGDFSVYNASQTVALQLPPGSAPGSVPRGMILGPVWFQAFANLPAKFTYMAHFANNSAGQKDNAAAAAAQAFNNIGSNLDALEIGNEIDFYPGDNRPANYSIATYLSEWKDYATAVKNATGVTFSMQAAGYYSPRNTYWSTPNTYGANGQGSADAQGFNVASMSLHNYMDGGPIPPSALQSNYMNHTRIAATLDTFKPAVAWLKANKPNIPLHLAEVNSNTYSSGNSDTLGVFGSALWLVDYMIYGMTLNIKRMNVQQSTGFSYASWRGVDYYGSPAAVLPPYYAHPFVADIIGSTGNIQIADLKLGQDMFSGYAVYDASTSKAQRIVLINLQTWKTTDGTTRPSKSITLSIGSTYTASVKIDKLTAPGADTTDSSQISWKGVSWTYASNGKPVQRPSTSISVRGNKGKIGPITVRASEAVVVNL
ncbi:glycoside hydrolase family 79 protein [Dothistroma septosporum NZE10]|uniref:Glycoside hydrolase family 79 protein n=1 Tax=Dothistroma septosporum (strain NZE10 / CBS 128990) TaxID=675120 RepID=N1PWK0_DOTSN|nr:glycoside hydrolase family 79 protein [Dothistroma septosporum NZE10]